MIRATTMGIASAFIAAACFLMPEPASAGVFISIRIGPPALPVYVQPPCLTAGYLWSPGYWAYGPMGYYWVPGVWVAPPRVGYLWTPGYWSFGSGLYAWHVGYWGPHVGFYGGVNYGFGYIGQGFIGGGWAGNVYRYNTAVTNVNTTVIHNTYVNRTVINNTTINNTTVNRVSYNGGPGGINAQPSAQEQAFAREQHFQATSNQATHEQAAARDRNQFASVNHGNPANASMDRVGGNHFNAQARSVNDRAQEQQQRVARGVAQGQLGAGQTARIERREQNINQQVRAERQANNGRLNAPERRQANREQNRASQEIHEDREKHEHR